jgi:hypothetical protein
MILLRKTDVLRQILARSGHVLDDL